MIPVVYNVRSVRVRWASALVAVLGIAGTVAVFVAMLSLARGFRAAMVSSGSPENAIVRRAGAVSEMDSSISLDELRVIADAPAVAPGAQGPLVSGEVVVVAAFPLRSSGTDANVQVRGVSPLVLDVRGNVRLVEGRMFRPGLPELVVGRNAQRAYSGFDLGASLRFGGARWTVVGVSESGGSAFESELWCDADVLNQVYQRPRGVFQSVTVRLDSAGDLGRFREALTSDPRLEVQVDRELDYYSKQSEMLSTLIVTLGSLVAAIMGIGALFGALNTMYSAVAERAREIATLRALGFGAGAVVLSFLIESLLIALAGGIIGCLIVLPINGVTTGTINWQTFSHLAFAFRVTPGLLGAGIAFAMLMGLLGGTPPAIRAARRPIVTVLR